MVVWNRASADILLHGYEPGRFIRFGVAAPSPLQRLLSVDAILLSSWNHALLPRATSSSGQSQRNSPSVQWRQLCFKELTVNAIKEKAFALDSIGNSFVFSIPENGLQLSSILS
jgi:hypothetical protein